MAHIADDAALRKALDALSPRDQRKVAVLFVNSVLDLTDDAKLRRLAEQASGDLSDEDRFDVLRGARRAAIDCHTRCGAEGDWLAQADYFIARGLIEAVAPPEKGKPGNPAWQAAMASRMARTCRAIESEDETADRESRRQYELLNNFLATK